MRPLERQPGCESCAANRQRLERAWQTVANETLFSGGYTQQRWAGELQRVLVQEGGSLRDEAQTQRALSTLLAALPDVYSVYLPPEAWARALGRTAGAQARYDALLATGAGLVTGGPAAGGGVRVEAVLADSPAEQAGVRRGDTLLALDGEPTDGLGAEELASLLRGPSGSALRLTLRSGASFAPPRTLSVERRALARPPLASHLLSAPGGQLAAYIRVRYFSSATTAGLARALRAGEALGVDGLVLDLRNNPGGVLEEAVSSASLLLPCGRTVAGIWRNGARPEQLYTSCALPAAQFDAQPPIAPGQRPRVALLLNGGTASAAEVFSAALRDNGRARLFGERSFGKSRIQFFFPQDAGGLRLTVKTWRGPGGGDVERGRRGMEPDVACRGGPAPLEEQPDSCVSAALRYIASGG